MLLDEIDVALHGHSFPNRLSRRILSASYRDRVEGMLNIGVHTSAEDRMSTRPMPPATSRRGLEGADYWALGHIHARRVERPWIIPGAAFRDAIEGKRCEGLHVGHRRGRCRGCGGAPHGRRASVDNVRVDAGGADVMTLTGRIETSVRAAIRR